MCVQLDQIEHLDISSRHQCPFVRRSPTDQERTCVRGPHPADTPPRVGNYLTIKVGNSVTDNPSNLGNYLTADTGGSAKPAALGWPPSSRPPRRSASTVTGSSPPSDSASTTAAPRASTTSSG